VRGEDMVELDEVECEFCGDIIKLKDAIKLNVRTGEYKYACPNCAKRWRKRGSSQKLGH
jgi:hypothetical protein